MTPINNNQMSELRDILTRCAVNGMHLQRVNKEFIESEVKQLSTLISHERAKAVRGLYDFCDNEVKEKKLSSEHCLLIKLVIEEYLQSIKLKGTK